MTRRLSPQKIADLRQERPRELTALLNAYERVGK
jgi:hypothetical protein